MSEAATFYLALNWAEEPTLDTEKPESIAGRWPALK